VCVTLTLLMWYANLAKILHQITRCVLYRLFSNYFFFIKFCVLQRQMWYAILEMCWANFCMCYNHRPLLHYYTIIFLTIKGLLKKIHKPEQIYPLVYCPDAITNLSKQSTKFKPAEKFMMSLLQYFKLFSPDNMHTNR